MALNSNAFGAYNAFNDSHDPGGNWITRVFDPQGTEQSFNAYQAGIERDFNAQQAQISRDFNAQEAQKQRDFEERLSSTAYQRAASDLRKAGLNPYLMYGGASAASTPSGQSASSSPASAYGARSSGGQNMLGTLINSAFALATTVINKKLPSKVSGSYNYYHSHYYNHS